MSPVGSRACVRALAPRLLELLFPTDCAHCAAPLDGPQAHGVCAGCWSELRPLAGSVCPGCGAVRPGARPGPARPCAGCRTRPSEIDGIRCAVAYEGVARTLVLLAKSGRRPEILAAVAPMLAAVVADARWTDCDRIVPAPTSPVRRWLRGFDPARVLSGALSGILGVPHGVRDLRRRLRPGPPVKSLSAAARERALRGAFVARPAGVSGRRVLLVDDVVTTGSTVRACARALRAAGAAEVRVASWARTPV